MPFYAKSLNLSHIHCCWRYYYSYYYCYCHHYYYHTNISY